MGLDMLNSTNVAQAGLVFLTECDLDIVAAANQTANGFEAMGHRITGIHVLSDDRAQVSTTTHDLILEIVADVKPAFASDTADLFLSVALYGHKSNALSQFASDALLAHLLQALNEALEPDFVQWKETDCLLASDQFTQATRGEKTQDQPRANGKSRSTRRHKMLPDVETINNVLQERISNHDPEIFDALASSDRLKKIFSDGWIDPSLEAELEAAEARAKEMEDIEEAAPLRLSAWFMSFAVVLIALPVGVTLLIVNMAKGENLRLSSQTAALTGTFVAFQTLGTTASALEAIDKLLN